MGVSVDKGKLWNKGRSVGTQRSGGHGVVSVDTEWSVWGPGAGGISQVRGEEGVATGPGLPAHGVHRDRPTASALRGQW